MFLCVVLFANGSGARQDPQDFNLRNLKCAPVSLDIALGPEARRFGLTEQAMRDAAESRLRSARLMNSEASSNLLVTVEFLKIPRGHAFLATVALRGWVTFNMGEIFSVLGEALIDGSPRSEEAAAEVLETALNSAKSGVVIIWEKERIGTVRDDALGGQFILNRLNGILDTFIATYLRMNKGQCPSRLP